MPKSSLSKKEWNEEKNKNKWEILKDNLKTKNVMINQCKTISFPS